MRIVSVMCVLFILGRKSANEVPEEWEEWVDENGSAV